MKTWIEAVSERFYITSPCAGHISVWGKTRSGKKSRSLCGWDIRDAIRKMPECKCFEKQTFRIFKDHIELFRW